MAFGLISADDKNKIASFGEEIVSVAQNDKNVTFTKSNGNTSTLRLPDDFYPKIHVTNIYGGVSVTATCDNNIVTADVSALATDVTLAVSTFGVWTVTLTHQCSILTKTLSVTELKVFDCDFEIFLYDFALKNNERIALFDTTDNPLVSNGVSYLRTPLPPAVTIDTIKSSSWNNHWIFKNIRPCMLKYDGTVDYYLDPDDHTKKLDGTPSDVSNVDYPGNAMVQIPTIWLYESKGAGTSQKHFFISNIRFTSDFHAYAHMRADSTVAPYFYHAMFLSSGDSSKIRSLKGRSIALLTSDDIISGSIANGNGWYTRSYMQWVLFQFLGIFITQDINWYNHFPYLSGYDQSDTYKITGLLSDKGMFAYNTYSSANILYNKRFFVENNLGYLGYLYDVGFWVNGIFYNSSRNRFQFKVVKYPTKNSVQYPTADELTSLSSASYYDKYYDVGYNTRVLDFNEYFFPNNYSSNSNYRELYGIGKTDTWCPRIFESDKSPYSVYGTNLTTANQTMLSYLTYLPPV